MLYFAAATTYERRRDAAAYEAFVEEAIEPFNEVGLFAPPAPNMYPHTAAPVTP